MKLHPTDNLRKRRVLTMLLVVIVSTAASANHYEESLDGSNFEIDTDANLIVDDTSPPPPHPDDGEEPPAILPLLDWATVAEQRSVDLASGSGDDAFGQGSKEDTEVPTKVAGSIPPNKSDLKTFGVYKEGSGSDAFLHFFWHRVQDPSGTTNMDFELNQGTAGLSTNGVTPNRVYMDALIQYDLSNGGTKPDLFISRWLVAGEGHTAAECEASNKLPCWSDKENLSAAGSATGSINTSAISNANSDGLGPISPRTFGEASIDFDAFSDDSDECTTFGSVYLKSRSSDSFTAALKDFIAPITAQISNCAGLTIIKQDDSTPPKLLGGAEFKLFVDNAPIGGSPGAEDPDVLSDTPERSCTTASPPSSDAGMCTMLNVPAGEYWLYESNVPTGHDAQVPNPSHVTVVAGVNKTVYIENPRIPATVVITKQDDDGNLLPGVEFRLYEWDSVTAQTPGTYTGKSCTTGALELPGPVPNPDAGKCTISNIEAPGDYCLDEQNLPAGYVADTNLPDCFSLALNQTKNVTYVNPRKPATVVITKQDDAGNLLPGVEFRLYEWDGVTAQTPGTYTGKSCTTGALELPGPVPNPDAGKCTISNIEAPGDYCLGEQNLPAGYVADTDLPDCFSLALDQTKNVTYVNPRKPATVQIHKEDDAGNDLAGVQFVLYVDGVPVGTYQAGTDTDVEGMCTTDANGDCTISNVEAPGNYCIVETNLPDGYSADSDLPECFSVVLDQTKVLSYVNPRATGAIKITKTRKHAADGSGDHAHAGVTFTITGGSLDDPGMDVLTDSNGEACLDGLVLSEFVGDYTVTETLPDGYVADGPLSKDVSVTTATTCGTGLEDTVSFSNTPLTDFTVSVNSQVDGGTHSTITCTGGPGNINETDGGTPSLDDPSLTVLSLPPGLYTCVIDIDP